MPIKHLPPARHTRSQARAQAVLTPTPRAPFDSTPEVPQLRAHYGRKEEGQEDQILFQEYLADFQDFQRPLSQVLSEPSLLAIMQQMTQIMANLQEASSSDSSRPPAFKTQSMKAPECFDGTQTFKVRSFIQSYQLIFHNYLENFSQDGNKVRYATSFLIGRDAKWIEPYLSNLTNQDPNYLLNSWQLFESQLFTLFGGPNEVRKAEAELDSLRMKEGGNVSL
ncbi:hypothetical protein O181_130533 [Austropuccinia psidii MF-1]|uniref:Retrotransposon gag domain-containing protein n=1 Tax=Austropuccinia psidii MF-1 TaxID=1389203 RepID=A0A9Q3KYU8_9BASI|nr:hypothetical protein [Austropuccinia psidii MF-1]